jgi:chromosome segregation ATPase
MSELAFLHKKLRQHVADFCLLQKGTDDVSVRACELNIENCKKEIETYKNDSASAPKYSADDQRDDATRSVSISESVETLGETKDEQEKADGSNQDDPSVESEEQKELRQKIKLVNKKLVLMRKQSAAYHKQTPTPWSRIATHHKNIRKEEFKLDKFRSQLEDLKPQNSGLKKVNDDLSKLYKQRKDLDTLIARKEEEFGMARSTNTDQNKSVQQQMIEDMEDDMTLLRDNMGDRHSRYKEMYGKNPWE